MTPQELYKLPTYQNATYGRPAPQEKPVSLADRIRQAFDAAPPPDEIVLDPEEPK